LTRRALLPALILGLALPAIAAGGALPPPAAGANLAESALLRSRKLMPASLRQILERRESWLIRGFREPARPADLAGSRRELEAALAEQRLLLAGFPLFDDVVANFGRIARAVCELNALRRYCPDDQAAAWLDDYEPYTERKGALFVPVFYDYSPVLFTERNLTAYVETMEARNRAYAERVLDVYRRGGTSRTFDDRSPAFGLAALHYSHTITDIANVWLYGWREANGDLGGVPFFPYPAAKPTQEKAGR
jgi:ribosome modulation factor